jgi:hypothetical protein
MRAKCTSVLDIIDHVRSSALLANYLKRAAAISVNLVQLELQKLIFVLSFYSIFQILDKMEAPVTETTFPQTTNFSLNKFLAVI